RKHRFSEYGRNPQLDVIEINEDLQHILRGKKFNLVHDDFLTFRSRKPYDLIIANFPFSDGAAHLTKALNILEDQGGKLICLVNAETIRNPYTRERQAINSRLSRLSECTIEYLAEEFVNAERRTNVEVALIR